VEDLGAQVEEFECHRAMIEFSQVYHDFLPRLRSSFHQYMGVANGDRDTPKNTPTRVR